MDCFPGQVHLTLQNVVTSNWQILKTAPQLIKQNSELSGEVSRKVEVTSTNIYKCTRVLIFNCYFWCMMSNDKHGYDLRCDFTHCMYLFSCLTFKSQFKGQWGCFLRLIQPWGQGWGHRAGQTRPRTSARWRSPCREWQHTNGGCVSFPFMKHLSALKEKETIASPLLPAFLLNISVSVPWDIFWQRLYSAALGRCLIHPYKITFLSFRIFPSLCEGSIISPQSYR